MEVNLTDIISVVLLLALLLIPVLLANLANRQHKRGTRTPRGEADTSTPPKRRRGREDQRTRQVQTPTDPQGASTRTRPNEIAQARALLRSGPAGLRQGLLVATILAPPRGLAETTTLAPLALPDLTKGGGPVS